jgi:hypothetical protein
MRSNLVKAAGMLALVSSLGACAGGTGGYTRPGELVDTNEFVENVLKEKGILTNGTRATNRPDQQPTS